MYMVLLILNDPEKCQNVLDAWEQAGAPGVTVLLSSGLGHIMKKMGLQEDLPLIPSLDDFFQQEETPHRTLFSIVRERGLVDRMIDATRAVLGDLNQPNNGILSILPVLEAYGLDRSSY
jgi:nitrogen regulatory protein P-II 1